ncbi:MAG: hypothetical protein C4K58_06360 [Flavobacteriaceae bacterium]|nr:MAG: hypothetical protein C4K58_06360 [Flavobacteriaceae bacterium]
MMLMISAVVISVLIMMAFAGPVSKFVNDHPSIQILGLAFLILIGVMLLAEASHLSHFEFFGSEVHSIPKGYLYFSIFFSMSVQFIIIKMNQGQSKPVHLHDSKVLEDDMSISKDQNS